MHSLQELKEGIAILERLVRERIEGINIKFIERREPFGSDFLKDGINVSYWIRPSQNCVELTLYQGSTMMGATEYKPYEVSDEDLMFAGMSEQNKEHIDRLKSHARKIADRIVKGISPR